MTWWTWLLLVVLCLVVLALIGVRLFRQVRALLREVSAATRRVSQTRAEADSAFRAWRTERTEVDARYLAALEQDVR